MDKQQAPSSPAVDLGELRPVDRIALDMARRSAGGERATDSAWTACPLPTRGIAIAADGSLRGCAFAATALTTDEEPIAAWRGPRFAALRASLAGGQLPTGHCAGCLRWLQADLAAASPCARAGAASAATGERPALTIELPPAGSEWPAPRTQQVLAAVAQAAAVEIVADDPTTHPLLEPMLAAARAAATPVQVTVRGRRFTAAKANTALRGVRSLRLDADGPIGIARLASLALAIDATAEVTFVPTPTNWHLLEDTVRSAADHGVAIDVDLQGSGNEVPLAALEVADLRLVRDVTYSLWPRLGGEVPPRTLRRNAFDLLCSELRVLLQERTEAAVAGVALAAPRTTLALPALDHPWFADASRRDGWITTLLGQGHLQVVRSWLLEQLAGDAAMPLLKKHAWLRAMAQRFAWEQRNERVLQLLRDLYSQPRKRSQLVHEDAAFASAVDLVPFGGPWAERLGIAQERARKRPFAVGKRVEPAAAAPIVTVLIPSYRHGLYVEETIQSVLGQRKVPFRVLVVDDVSPDDTVARARAIADPRLEVRVNPTNLGLGNSVLQALATIDTPYVALLNSDDLFHPDRLARCCEVLTKNPTTQLVTTGMHLIDAQGGELRPNVVSLVLDGQKVFDWVHWYERAVPQQDLAGDELFLALLERNFLATSSNLVCRTEWLRAHAGHLQSLKYCLDWQLFLEAALDGTLHHLRDPLVAYRLHATNTVWFREGRRWSYYLEVNRVAATAMRRFVERHAGADEAQVATVLDAIATHVATNRETDGLALFVNTVFDAVSLEQLTNTSPRVQGLVERLNQAAEAARRALDAAAEHQRQGGDEGLSHRLLLGDLARERADRERNDRRWLQDYVVSLEGRLSDCWDGRKRLEDEKQELLRRVQTVHDEHARTHAALQASVAERNAAAERADRRESDLQAELQVAKFAGAAAEARNNRLAEDLETLRSALRSVETLQMLIDAELVAVRSELTATRGELTATRGDLTATRGDLAATRGDLEAMRAERDATRTELESAQETNRALSRDLERHATDLTAARDAHAASQGESDRLQKQADELSVALAVERRSHESTLTNERLLRAEQQARDAAELERHRRAADAALAKAYGELETLRRSREYRAGNFLWNKMPLGYLSRRGKKWYRRLVDAKDRALMLFKRRNRAQGTAVVTACWQWPIYSHTFVYQEMIGLTHMGLDVRLFHWELGETAQLHKAFGYLADHRTQLQPVWENHLRDKAHFDKTKPGRLRSFLERVSAATGRSVEDLEKEPMVLQGCTFARMAELAGADYLHSYFFYDQSFMCMQAAWLLELPRGVSCYADHMLQDFPFKLVPLQVELSDVIVATSARIKRELSQMTGGRFDDKIIVKPNGVDGARFPPVVRQDRKPSDPFEVVSISRIEPKKGLTHLVEAVAMLKQRGRKVKAHIVGSKDPHSKGSLEYAAEFEALIEKLGVKDEVILHGMKKQEELPPILQRCRAFVAPYVEMGSGDKDGIPTAMLEGLASGLPVVTTDSGSILEVVTTEIEGLVVPQRDSAAFAAALERLIADPVLERRMAKAARHRFDREFDIRVTEVRLHERVAGLIKKRQRTHGKGKSQQPAN